MARLKTIRISTINWTAHFNAVNGSYYDYATSIYSNDNESHQRIIVELLGKGWRKITTSDPSLTIFEKDRHIIKLGEMWD